MLLKSVLLCTVLCCCLMQVHTIYDRPVIGVVLQESRLNDARGDMYMMSAYVEYVQAAGAMAVPIRIKENDEYYQTMFQKVNGIFLPGGALYLTSEYGRAARKLIKIAIDANKKGDYFPVWGTCLGAELLTQTIAGNESIFTRCNAYDLHLPLNILPDGKDSRILHNMHADDFYVLTHDHVNANYHHQCLTPKTFEQNENLKKMYKPIATNYDKKGIDYISLFEAIEYPIYGSQFHPEKVPFLWTPNHRLNHSAGAVKVSQYFGNFFVSEARKSGHRYPDNETLSNELFYNYVPIYLGYPQMVSNYYFNYTRNDDSEFQSVWKMLKGDDFFTVLAKDRMNTLYLIFSVVIFFFLGISFVFVMDYAVTLSGRLFRLTPRTSPTENHQNVGYAYEGDEIKEKLLSDYSNEKVPLRDGPSL